MQDPKTESFLKRGGWRFKYYPGISLDEIDVAGALANEARLDQRLDDDRVLEYSYCLEHGDHFPAVVLLKTGGKYAIATGLHRLKAAEIANTNGSRRRGFDAYVVSEGDEYRREVLTRQLNMIEGIGLGPDHKIQQVLELHRRYPDRPLKLLADEWRVQYDKLRKADRENSVDRRAVDCGVVPTFRTLAQQTKLALAAIPNDTCFAAAAQLFVEAKSEIKGDVAIQFAREIAHATKRRERDGLALVLERRKAIETDDRQKKARLAKAPTSRATRFVGLCRSIQAVVPNGLVSNLHLATLGKLDCVRVNVAKTVELLQQVLSELDLIEERT